jgi:DnaJ-class molecular chaperone
MSEDAKVIEDKCSRCGGSGWDPEHGDHEQPFACLECEGGGTMEAVQKRRDREDRVFYEPTRLRT